LGRHTGDQYPSSHAHAHTHTALAERISAAPNLKTITRHRSY